MTIDQPLSTRSGLVVSCLAAGRRVTAPLIRMNRRTPKIVKRHLLKHDVRA